MRVSQTKYDEVFQILNDAKEAGKGIGIVQSYLGEVEIKTYRFSVRFPEGCVAKAVHAWYSDDWKNDRLDMTTHEMACYICDINSGRGGKGASCTVQIVG